jgi:hypothetical protein
MHRPGRQLGVGGERDGLGRRTGRARTATVVRLRGSENPPLGRLAPAPGSPNLWLRMRVARPTSRSAMNRHLLRLTLAAAGVLGGGCASENAPPLEMKPIHAKLDVNAKVDRALDDFFGDLDRKSTTLVVPKS